MDNEWQQINYETDRLKVDGGYLYRTKRMGVDAIAMSFVPDVDLTRYQAHLRDAYNQGFKDGMTEAHANLSSAMKCSE